MSVLDKSPLINSFLTNDIPDLPGVKERGYVSTNAPPHTHITFWGFLFAYLVWCLHYLSRVIEPFFDRHWLQMRRVYIYIFTALFEYSEEWICHKSKKLRYIQASAYTRDTMSPQYVTLTHRATGTMLNALRVHLSIRATTASYNSDSSIIEMVNFTH